MFSALRQEVPLFRCTFRALSMLTIAGCGGDAGDNPNHLAQAQESLKPVPTASAPANPCGWISSKDVEAILGSLQGRATVVRSLERAEPDSNGSACRYDLATNPRIGKGAVILQVDLSGGIMEERVGGGMAQSFREAIQATVPAKARASSQPETPPPGWDRVTPLWTGYSTFSGRVGHVAISALALTPEIPRSLTVALATRVRDAMPDLPFPLPPDPDLEALSRATGEPLVETPTGPDPCGLIPAAQAEAVLGTLVVPPYRSADNSPLATPSGPSCAYYTAGHRVFVVRPHWDSGRMLFGMARGVGGIAGGVMSDDTAAASDTLEGPWEEATANGMTGQLYFLKADRMLELAYLTSSTDRAGAVRLARIAMEHL